MSQKKFEDFVTLTWHRIDQVTQTYFFNHLLENVGGNVVFFKIKKKQNENLCQHDEKVQRTKHPISKLRNEQITVL